ncbi:hypothetical protein M5362_25055 [Streptomyces sp. Je 1-79]|uniref:hypothetical protein n=1 Tax=Streptomyces sp. Je 1-79 TaxID=2943847 RepID=UPI0021A81528|nr:hypothetical protein [Streptomyces sp. Je 1-79]MCT4356401.1 hypothetical protein [Streptomyces sp. Je 1-79]
MTGMRGALLGAVLAAVVVGGAGTGASAHAVGVEADLAHHGHLSLSEGRIGVRLVTENHGPSDVYQATVRLAFSESMAGGQELPPSCLWGSDRVVVCRTGELRAAGAVDELALDLRTAGSPDEVTVDIATLWRDGAADTNPGNDRHRVLVLATGDPYVF